MGVRYYCDVCGCEINPDQIHQVQINIYKPNVQNLPITFMACPDHAMTLEKAVNDVAPKKTAS